MKYSFQNLCKEDRELYLKNEPEVLLAMRKKYGLE